MQTYRDVTHWTKYQAFYPKALRCEQDRHPVEEWWRWREHDIHLDRHVVPDAAYKVIFLHGGGGYGRMFAPIGIAGRELGFETVAPDLPGYGLSRGPTVDYQDWIDCVGALVESERIRDDRPIILCGGSLGGLLAYTVAATKTGSVKGVIATCLLDPTDRESHRHLAKAPWMGKHFGTVMKVLRPLDRFKVPIRWVSKMEAIVNDQALAKVCMTDPVGGGNWVSIRFLRTLLTTRLPAPESFRACPLLLVHGTDDRWTPLALSMKTFDRLACPKDLALIEGGGHFVTTEPELEILKASVARFLTKL